MRICTIDGCGKRLAARGLCAAHYRQDRIDNPRFIPHTPLERFMAKVEVNPGGCWLWIAGFKTTGYGSFSINDTPDGAHRASWMLHFGPIPDGLFVLHRCDVRACVRPDHLFLGDHQANVTDMVGKGRNPRGTAHAHSRLTDDEVAAIRAASGTQRAIAATFGISQGAVSRIRKGQRYR
jgi:hypothetical protein